MRAVWAIVLTKAYQGNTLDIGLDTFPSLVSISQVGECITKTLQKPPSSRHALTRVSRGLESTETQYIESEQI